MLRFRSVAEPKLGDSWLSCVFPCPPDPGASHLVDGQLKQRSEALGVHVIPETAWKSQLFGCYTGAVELLGSASVALSRRAVRTAAQDGSSDLLLQKREVVICMTQKASKSWGFLSSSPGRLVRALRAAEDSLMSSLVTVNFLRKEKASVGCQRLEETWFLVYLLLPIPSAAQGLKVCL